jgi:hypothetical protein
MATEFELTVLSELGDIKANLAKNTEATLALAGDHGRVTQLESQMKTLSTRSWIQTVVVVPLFGVIHATLNHFGVRI